MAQIEEGLRKFEELEKVRGVSYKDDPRRVTLLRIKIRDTATLAHSKEEAKQLRNLIESASGACVTVLRETYPGAVIQIEDTKLLVQNYVKAAEFTSCRIRSRRENAHKTAVEYGRSFTKNLI